MGRGDPWLPSRVGVVDFLTAMSIEARVAMRSVGPSLVLLAMGATAVGCTSAAGQESRGATSGDGDTAVGYTQHTLENDPQRHECRIALERAMISPSRQHIPAWRAFEPQEPPAALREYRAAACDQSKRDVVSGAVTPERTIRERIEATRPPAPLEAMHRLARRTYDEPIIQAFDIAHADGPEPPQVLNQIVQVPGMAVRPSISPSTLGNTITLPATATVISIVERVIAATDRPLADIVIDVKILQVNRDRTRHYGLNLTDYALGAASSPEVAPPTDALPPSAAGTPQSFNVSTVSRGDSATDLYLGVPAAVVRSLETDSETKRVARPQLRGQEGQTMTFSLGGDVPVPTTAVTPIAHGGVAVPLTAFDYRPVGIVVEITPRVTFEGEIILDLTVENNSLSPDIDVANSLPTFETRRVVTRLRLRDAESGLLTGLLREQDRETLAGFPGVLGAPLLWSPLGDTQEAIRQTDIVMLLTPRIVRTRELTPRHIDPIHIGAQTNLARAAPPAPNGDADSDGDPPTPTAPPPLATDPAPAPLPAPVRLKLARGLGDQKPARLRLTRWLSGREPLQEQPADSGTEAGTGLEFTRTLLD